MFFKRVHQIDIFYVYSPNMITTFLKTERSFKVFIIRCVLVQGAVISPPFPDLYCSAYLCIANVAYSNYVK